MPSLRILSVVTLCLLFFAGCEPVKNQQASSFQVADDTEAETAAPVESTDTPSAVEDGTTDNVPAEAEPAAESPTDAPNSDEPVEPPAGDQANDPIVPEEDPHPFPRRIEMPPLPGQPEWLNTAGPLRLKDLRGKFVILDFWTYCCINCLHVLPELDKLEKKYPNEVVVIGVHSAKFETEQDTKNIEEAILRYNIKHPVVNDSDHEIWNAFGVSSWPTLLLIDPAGDAVWMNAGETKFETLDEILTDSLPYYREKKLLDETPVHVELLAHSAEPTPLRFPGKVLADEASNRLYITDTNHHRIVITDLEGKLIEIIGSGAVGNNDGNFLQATFKQPHGLALHGETLYVADTENHLLRKVDLKEKNVSTIAGVGKQARYAWPGIEKLGRFDELPERWVGEPRKTGLNSPWALWVNGDQLYIAMAGPHQIWKMPLDESEIGPYAGNGREDIVDGPLIPQQPFDLGFSSFAQPSGLTGDGTWLYVADSEGSSVRAVPFDPQKEVKTVIGTNELPGGRLFTFGDEDGPREQALLQHVLGVSYHEGKIYIADTYNNKIKFVDAETGEVQTLAGRKEPGLTDGPAEKAQFDEPAGLCHAAGMVFVADTNNHAIRVVDATSGETTTLTIDGLEPPVKPKSSGPNFAKARVKPLDAMILRPADGKITLQLDLTLPLGWKLNPLAPMGYKVEAEGSEGPIQRDSLGEFIRMEKPDGQFQIEVPITGEGKETVDVSLLYYYCQEGGEGFCKVGSIVWRVPVTISAEGKDTVGKLPLEIQPGL